MDSNENQLQNNKEDKPMEEAPKSSDEEQINQPTLSHEVSSPKEMKGRVTGARILRDMVGGSLGIRRWPEIREKLNEIEDILEEEYLKRGTEENK